MTRFRKILVPTDFSDCSAAALRVALDLALPLQARLRLLHVYPAPSLVFDPYGIQPAEPVLLEAPKAARQRLEQEVEEASGAGIEVDGEVREGAPAPQILEEAREWGADLIVMGTHGHTGIEHVLLGSVAERSVRLAPCPVLTVRHPG
jgi:nucleotide-binding universal stress UspA family protein